VSKIPQIDRFSEDTRYGARAEWENALGGGSHFFHSYAGLGTPDLSIRISYWHMQRPHQKHGVHGLEAWSSAFTDQRYSLQHSAWVLYVFDKRVRVHD
jgi:hypothetical protein